MALLAMFLSLSMYVTEQATVTNEELLRGQQIVLQSLRETNQQNQEVLKTIATEMKERNEALGAIVVRLEMLDKTVRITHETESTADVWRTWARDILLGLGALLVGGKAWSMKTQNQGG